MTKKKKEWYNIVVVLPDPPDIMGRQRFTFAERKIFGLRVRQQMDCLPLTDLYGKDERGETSMIAENNEELEERLKGYIAYSDQIDGIMSMMKAEFVSCDLKEKTWTTKILPDTWMKNPMNIMHGGLIATFVDFAMGVLAGSYAGRGVTTSSLQLSYLLPVQLDRDFYAEVKLNRAGRHLAYLNCRGWQEDPENPCMTATSTFFLFPEEADEPDRRAEAE